MRFKALLPLSAAAPLAASVIGFYPISYNNSQPIGSYLDVQITNEVLDHQDRSFTLGDVVVNVQDNLIGEVFGGGPFGQDGYVEWTTVAGPFNPPPFVDSPDTQIPGNLGPSPHWDTVATPEPGLLGFLVAAAIVMWIAGPRRSKGEE